MATRALRAEPKTEERSRYRWLRNGRAALDAMLAAIAQARHSVRLETFIFHAGEIGDAFRDALVAARKRGVRVRASCATRSAR